MAGKQDIEAGSAFVRLYLNDTTLNAGLKKVGRGLAIAGGALVAAGAALTTPLIHAVHKFAEAGAALHEMSERTGVSVRELSFLKFAADQTGASLEALEPAIRKFIKGGGDPRQLKKISEQIAAIRDPVERARLALQLFGARSGAVMLPILIHSKELREEFAKLGLEMSGEAAERAAKLHQAMKQLASVISKTWSVIGSAVEPLFTPVIKFMIGMALAVEKFAKENPALFRTLMVVGVALGVVGTALATLGASLIFVTFLVSALVTIFTFLIGAAPILIPIAAALATIGITLAAVAAWLLFTKSGQAVLQGLLIRLRALSAGLMALSKDIRATFKGVGDAIAAGNIDLAWKILMAGMAAEWHKFAAMMLNDLARIVTAAGGLLGATVGAPALLALAKGHSLDAAIKTGEAKRLSAQAAAAAMQTGEAGYTPGGEPAKLRATVIGTNARAALMSGQIMGAGRSPVVDTLMKMITEEKKTTAILERILRTRGAMR